MLSEELTKAAQAADLLAADLRAAVAVASKENPLAGLYVQLLLNDAIELRGKIQLAETIAQEEQ